jgi:ubiquinone/menaquinone biosynthesis C-methylase UbiE
MDPKFATLKLSSLAKKIPEPAKKVLRFFKLHEVLAFLANKYTAEWRFQVEWAEEFKKPENQEKVLEYWKKYRYLDDIKNICKFNSSSKVLDVGCGISTVLHFVEGERHGIDPIAEEYKKLYQYPSGIKIEKALGEKIPFSDEYFSVVFCTNVLDHVTSPEQTLSEIHRVLKRSGYFVLTVEVFTEAIKRDHAHPHSLTNDHLRDLLKSKFKIIFEKQSPWIGMRNYVEGKKGTDNKELIFVLEKI